HQAPEILSIFGPGCIVSDIFEINVSTNIDNISVSRSAFPDRGIASWRTLRMARRKKDVPGLPYTASPLSCVAFFVKEHTGLLRIDTKRKRG
ncbi:hypothetical protein, partial [Hespellia stercorisuis]|uniref:hypothetical protein n=1 Tax=Hespellia stercorisuis TaxID=180311 RepID=UPI001A9A46C8